MIYEVVLDGVTHRVEVSEREGRSSFRIDGKELFPDIAGEITVDREVEPFEDIADQAGQRGPQRGLTSGDRGRHRGIGHRAQNYFARASSSTTS